MGDEEPPQVVTYMTLAECLEMTKNLDEKCMNPEWLKDCRIASVERQQEKDMGNIKFKFDHNSHAVYVIVKDIDIVVRYHSLTKKIISY